MGPLTALLDAPKLELPDIIIPDLASLEVHVPAAPLLRVEEVQAEVARRARRVGERRERARGERVRLGDDLCVDLILTSGGQFVPFMLEFEDWRELQPIPGFPGVSEALAECGVVDQCAHVDVTIPEDFLFEAFRGRPGRFVVAILRAVEVTPPSTDVFKKVGLGTNLAEATVALQAEVNALARSRPVVDRLITQALASRVEWEPPARLVEHEILSRWADKVGRGSVERKFSIEQQRELLSHWMSAPWIRSEVIERLRGTMVLWAIARRDGLQLEESRVAELFASASADLGLTAEAVTEGLMGGTPDLSRRVQEAAYLESVIAYVRSRVKVTFG